MKSTKIIASLALMAILAVNILLLGGCSSGAQNAGSDDLALNPDTMFSYYSGIDDSLKVANLKGDTFLTTNIDKEYVSPLYYTSKKIDYSLNETECAALVNYKEETGGELYCVTASGSVKVAEKVYDMRISDDGTTIAYIAQENEVGVLYIYDAAKNESIEISKQAVLIYCISPDGKCFAYATWTNNGGNLDVEKYVSIDGAAPELTDYIPLAISNNADYMYYLDIDMNLYVTHSEKITSLASALSLPTLYLNSNYTEAMFLEEQNGTYNICISIDGEEKTAVANGLIDYVSNQPVLVLDGLNIHKEKFGYSSVEVFNVDSFKNTFADFSGALMYVNDSYIAEEIANYCEYAISADGKSLLYCTEDGILHVAQNSDGSLKNEDIDCSEKITEFSASNDLSTIYGVNNANNLFLIKNNGKTKKIADGVTSFQASSSGNIVYYIDWSNSFLYSKNGKEGVNIESLHSLGTFYTYRDAVFYIDFYSGKDGNDIYILDGTSATLLYPETSFEENLFE